MWREGQREKTRYSWITHAVFKLLIWSDGLCEFIYSSNLHAILNKGFAGISFILKSKAQEWVMRYMRNTALKFRTWLNTILLYRELWNMTFPKLSGFIYFFLNFPGLEIAVLKFHDFSRFFMTVWTLIGCGSGGLSKSDKNIGAGGWRMDNVFEAADSGDVLAHPRITSIDQNLNLESIYSEQK